MQAEVLAGNTSFLSALLHISPTCLLSGLLLVCPRRPQEEFTSFPEGCGQNPRAPAGRKKRGALERPSVQRSAFPEVTLVGRGSFHVLIQFAREGIPKACRRLWLREFFFFHMQKRQGRWCTFFDPLPPSPETRKLPEPQNLPRQEKAVSFSD